MKQLKAFFQNYTDELLYKVQWPTMPELQSSTVTVLIASLIIAIVVAAMDGIFKFVMMEGLYSLFSN